MSELCSHEEAPKQLMPHPASSLWVSGIRYRICVVRALAGSDTGRCSVQEEGVLIEPQDVQQKLVVQPVDCVTPNIHVERAASDLVDNQSLKGIAEDRQVAYPADPDRHGLQVGQKAPKDKADEKYQGHDE
eukprot:scaffold663336_cov59-Prasinocladus_malaysianus.AAC.1